MKDEADTDSAGRFVTHGQKMPCWTQNLLLPIHSKCFCLQFLGPLPKEAEMKHHPKSPFRNFVQTLTVDASCHSQGVAPTESKHSRYFCSEKGKIQKSSLGNKPVKGDPLWPSVLPKVPLPKALNPVAGCG